MEFANAEAANSVVPTRPTMIVSAILTVTCPNWASITGNASVKFLL